MSPLPASSIPSAPYTLRSRSSQKRKLPDNFETPSHHRNASKAETTADDGHNGHNGHDKKQEAPKAQGEGGTRATRREKRQVDEKRLKRFRPKPPQQFTIIYDRATSQRFYILSRTRLGTNESPEETIQMTGSTGNIYHVRIARLPTCTCPHSQKGNQCKHIIYVMSRVLRARFDLVYQLALLASELREIFSHAPPIEISDGNSDQQQEIDKNRKEVDGDCPICFTPFEGSDNTVYCRAQCGQNLHEECFQMWAATKRTSVRDKVTCPMCRAPWEGDNDVVKKIQNTGIVGEEGCYNLLRRASSRPAILWSLVSNLR
ncbi:hypothetical protein SLS62_009349 [Diatrype stigma]|uniref:Uncharacterized protein n=1 Tax=Diatrype stigma TaxID=117547 RepID=A0AAN9YKW0_9PEZI